MNLQSLYKDWILLFSKINDSDIQLYLQANQSGSGAKTFTYLQVIS